jgi:hypothetical protein
MNLTVFVTVFGVRRVGHSLSISNIPRSDESFAAFVGFHSRSRTAVVAE